MYGLLERKKNLGNDIADGCEALTPSFAREQEKEMKMDGHTR